MLRAGASSAGRSGVAETEGDSREGAAWGAWGESDELGALNRLTPAMLVAAAQLVKEGRVVSLSIPIDDRPNRPRLPQRAAPKHLMAADGGDFLSGRMRSGRAFISEDYLFLCVHEGTHLDGLAHVGADGALYNGHPARTVTSQGAERCGMEKVPSIVGRGVLLDAQALAGGECLEPGQPIDEGMIRACCERQSVEIRAGDAVYVRTGWMDRHTVHGCGLEEAEPGLTMEAGVALAEAGVVAIGMDNFGIEPYPPGSHLQPRDIPVHVELIRNRGVYLLEFCSLDELAATGRSTFLSVIAPLRVTGGVGSPVNPLAIL